jgi:NodT family efflux transporter outer membrane factor (OMF) lipoprotein
MSRFSRRLPLVAALALSGCVNLAPHYERPAAPVADRFPAAGSAGAAAPVSEDWRGFFADASLQQLMTQALQNNRDLRVAVLNVEAARAQAGVRRADLFPTVNLAVAGQRQPGPNGQQTSTYTAGLGVAAYELDLFGRVRSASDAALAQLAASEEARRAAQITLVASVANLYYALQADDALIDLSERTVGTRDESLRLTRLKFEHGAASDFDVQLARSLVESARVALAQQRRQRALDRDALELLVGAPLPDAPAKPGAGAWQPQALPEVAAGLPSQVLLRRPDVRQAEQQLIAANANIGAARAAFFPHITLTGSFGTASSELNGLFHNTAWTFAPQLLQPLFDAGRNRANLEAAKAARDIAVAQYERAIQSAFRDVADALASRAALDDQLKATAAQADAEERRYKLSQLRFDNGVASTLELLDAQRSWFTAQQALIQTQLGWVQSRIAVYRALAGEGPEAGAAK